MAVLFSFEVRRHGYDELAEQLHAVCVEVCAAGIGDNDLGPGAAGAQDLRRDVGLSRGERQLQRHRFGIRRERPAHVGGALAPVRPDDLGAEVIRAVCERVPTVALEWFDPVFIAGHWTPQLIDYAGGDDVLFVWPFDFDFSPN